MNKPHAQSWKSSVILLTICLPLIQGCATDPSDIVIGPGYKPRNVYHSEPPMPPQLRRVAVLPVTIDGRDLATESGQETLQPVLYAELAKLKAFELVFVSGEQLQTWTGRREWTAEEKLPPDFFHQLREATGCEGVIFSRLTQYRPYMPLAVGWNLKLVDCDKPQIWWAVDEVFDAGEPSVANAARRYFQQHELVRAPLADSSSVLVSPRRFGQYAASAALATLPPR